MLLKGYHIYSWQFTNFRSKFWLYDMLEIYRNVSHKNIHKITLMKTLPRNSRTKTKNPRLNRKTNSNPYISIELGFCLIFRIDFIDLSKQNIEHWSNLLIFTHTISGTEPYPIDALPTCSQAHRVCTKNRNCLRLYNNYQKSCRVDNGGQCRMEDW